MITTDLHENLDDMPLPSREGAQLLDPSAPDLGCEHRPEPMPPEPDRLMAHVDAALVKQILHVPERQRKPAIQHHRQTDDLGARFEVLEGRALGHGQRLRNCPARLKASSSDKTLRTEPTIVTLIELNVRLRGNIYPRNAKHGLQ